MKTSTPIALIAAMFARCSVSAMKGPIVLVVVALAHPAYAEQVKPSDVLDFDVVTRTDDFVVRDDAYEMTFANKPQLMAQRAPLGGGNVANGAVLVDAETPGGDAGAGAVIVTILPIPADVAFDGEKGVKGTADSVLAALGTVSNRTERAFKLGGLEGHEIRAAGVRDRTRWRMRMYVAWDPAHHTLISIAAVFGPLAQKDAEADLAAFVKAFKVKPGAAPAPRAP